MMSEDPRTAREIRNGKIIFFIILFMGAAIVFLFVRKLIGLWQTVG